MYDTSSTIYKEVSDWEIKFIGDLQDENTINEMGKTVLADKNRSQNHVYQLLGNPKLCPHIRHELLKTKCDFLSIKYAVESNNVSLETVALILEKSNTLPIYEIIANYPELFGHQLGDIGEQLIASDPETALAIKIQRNPALRELFANYTFEPAPKLHEANIDYESIEHVKSEKELCKCIFGTAHPLEVQLLFSGDLYHFHGLNALSNLQQVFMNPVKGKLDRHRYLQFLDIALKGPNIAWVGKVQAHQLKAVFDEIGADGIIAIGCGNSLIEASDVVRMFGDLLLQAQECTSAMHHLTLLRKWRVSNPSLGKMFHQYMTRKNNAVIKHKLMHKDFEQAKLQPLVDEINQAEAEFEIFLPSNHDELYKLGKNQHHCVGSKHYAGLLAMGAGMIFALIPKVNGKVKPMSKGFTFQFDKKGQLLQAKGLQNCDVDAEWRERAQNVYAKLSVVE